MIRLEESVIVAQRQLDDAKSASVTSEGECHECHRLLIVEE